MLRVHDPKTEYAPHCRAQNPRMIDIDAIGVQNDFVLSESNGTPNDSTEIAGILYAVQKQNSLSGYAVIQKSRYFIYFNNILNFVKIFYKGYNALRRFFS